MIDARRATTPTRSARSCSSASTCRSAQGLGKVAGKIFRIGHLGYFNDLMLCGTLAGVEMGLALARHSASQAAASTPRWTTLAEAPAAQSAQAA